jgi:hypothetical protein
MHLGFKAHRLNKSKGKVFPVCTIEMLGVVEVLVHSFLTSGLDGG